MAQSTKLSNELYAILGVTGHQWALRNTWCYGPRLVYPLRRFTCFSLSLSVSPHAPCELRVEEKTSFYVGIVGKHSRQTDGRSERRTENLLYGTIYCTAQITKVTFLKKKVSAPKIYCTVLYGTNHKSYISNLKKNWARPRISYTYLCIVVS